MTDKKTRVLSIFGSRPEAIKMAPVISAMRAWPEHFQSLVCLTNGRSSLEQVLGVFDIGADFLLDPVDAGDDLSKATQAVLAGLRSVLHEAKPDVTLVQGDTTTTFAAALACFYARIPVAHVEAGVRSENKFESFPEEINRRLADCLCDLYFAPTNNNKENLLREGCADESVVVTGNTVIDALLKILPRVRASAPTIDALRDLDWSRKTILFTCHRQASYGDQLPHVCQAIKTLLSKRSDVNVICPVSNDPRVRAPVEETLGDVAGCTLVDPLDYVPFVGLMDRAHLILTDSDGIQEEAPTLDKPVLVLRDKTERMEAIDAGAARLVGTATDEIVAATERLLSDPQAYYDMAEAPNPYGDGKAGIRIVNALHRRYR